MYGEGLELQGAVFVEVKRPDISSWPCLFMVGDAGFEPATPAV